MHMRIRAPSPSKGESVFIYHPSDIGYVTYVSIFSGIRRTCVLAEQRRAHKQKVCEFEPRYGQRVVNLANHFTLLAPSTQAYWALV